MSNTISKRVQFHDNVHDTDIIINLHEARKGTYWSYESVDISYGPFNHERQAIDDAKVFTTYGTTNKNY